MFTQIQTCLADRLHEVGTLVYEFLSVFWTTVNCLRQQRRLADCSIKQEQRRRTLAWQVLYTFSERSDAACWKVWESVTGRGHSAVNSGTAAMTSDEPWSTEWRLCDWCARGLAASVTTATEAWHWFCCCSASRRGPAYLRCSLWSDRRRAIQQRIAVKKPVGDRVCSLWDCQL